MFKGDVTEWHVTSILAPHLTGSRVAVKVYYISNIDDDLTRVQLAREVWSGSEVRTRIHQHIILSLLYVSSGSHTRKMQPPQHRSVSRRIHGARACRRRKRWLVMFLLAHLFAPLSRQDKVPVQPVASNPGLKDHVQSKESSSRRSR